MIEAGINEDVPGNWRGFQWRYETIVGRLPRTAPRQVLEAIADELEDLWADVHQTLELFVESQDSNANESHSERHIQNSNPDLNSTDESEYGLGKIDEASGSAAKTDNVHSLPKRDLPLGMVLDACPEILSFARGGPIRMWRDLVAAADVARPTMGISPSAWQDAVEVMGAEKAAITVAAILERSDQISSRGGYLRNLTERAREQKFSVWPMIMALLRVKLDARAKAMAGEGSAGNDVGEGSLAPTQKEPTPRSSNALLDNLKKRGWDR